MSYIGKDVEVVTFNTATTFDVTGNITVGGTVDGRDVAVDRTKLDTIATNAIANLSEDTTPQLGGNLDLNTSNVIGTGNINVTGSITGTSFVSTGDMSFTNNSKAKFGTSPSLEIYHDGSNSILDDVGAGNFKMQLAGADKLEVTSSGVDITGTITSDGLTVDGDATISSGTPTLQLTDTGGTNQFATLKQDGSNLKILSRNNTVSGGILLRRNVGGTETDAIQLSANGDVSLYASDGATQGFFWDASTQRLGLGTTSPVADLTINKDTDTKIQIISSNGGTNRIVFGDQADQSRGDIKYDHANEALTFSTNNMIEAVRIDSSGNVGININAPSYALDVKGIGSYNSASFRGQGASIPTYLYSDSTYWAFGDAPSYGGNLWGGHATNNELYAYTNGSERFRIDSSGNLLVGTTSTSIANTGLRFSGASNYLAVTRASAAPLILNLTTSDGDIAQFRKDNTAVGSIGAKNGDIFISGTAANSGIRFYDTNPALTACSTDGSDADAALSLGVGSVRFKDLHLSGQANVGTAVAATQTASVTGSTTLDFSTYQNFILTMTGNITLANPTTEQAGQTGFMILIHSGAARTVSLGTDYETAGAAGLTLSGTSGAVDLVPYVVQSSGNILLGTPQLAFS